MMLNIKPVDVSFLLAPIPSGTPMRAKAKQASENDCLEVTAFESLARSFLLRSGVVFKYERISLFVMEEALKRRFLLVSKLKRTGSTSSTVMGILVPLASS